MHDLCNVHLRQSRRRLERGSELSSMPCSVCLAAAIRFVSFVWSVLGELTRTGSSGVGIDTYLQC